MQSRSRALVQSLVDALDDLLRRSPDEAGVTLEALVQRAGVGVGSFYEYFSNKDSLVGVLVDKATADNFQALLARIDREAEGDLDARLRVITAAVAETYLRHPGRTRMLMEGIGRLGLLPMVVRERARFARELAARLAPLVPHAEPEAFERTVVLASDACMAFAGAELLRVKTPDVDAASQEMFELCAGLVRMRHPVDPPAG